MSGQMVIFRTLDIGGEKVPAYWEIAGEPNPQLGLRSIRFSLRHPEQFCQQVRAILRAGTDTARLGIMFPMISSLDEFAGCGSSWSRACRPSTASACRITPPHP